MNLDFIAIPIWHSWHIFMTRSALSTQSSDGKCQIACHSPTDTRQMKHFLTLKDLPTRDLCALVERAMALKKMGRCSVLHRPLDRRLLAMLFTKRSTRTRVSAEAGWTLLGGHPSFFSNADIQLGAGEPIQDTARVLSSMTDAILARLGPHKDMLVGVSYNDTPL